MDLPARADLHEARPWAGMPSKSALMTAPTYAQDIRVVRAEGSILTDAKGREYVDFLSGWCVGNLGWAHPAITAALNTFDGPDYVWPHLRYEPWDELAARLRAIVPGDLSHSFRAVGGTESVELAMQAAQAFTGRKRIVGLKGSYHGNSLGAQAIRRVVPGSLDDRALKKVRSVLSKRDVAALIMEPIPINLGVRVPEPAFMEGVAEACGRYGTLLILDEVATGFGRTGKLFATEHLDASPDILCLAKGITGGHAPLGATVVTEEIAEAIGEEFEGYSTYGWHPRSVAAALATLDVFEKKGEPILAKADRRGEQIARRLAAMGGDAEGAEVRAVGMAIAMDLADEEVAAAVEDRCREGGLLLMNVEGTLLILPALTIDRETTERGLDILEEAFG